MITFLINYSIFSGRRNLGTEGSYLIPYIYTYIRVFGHQSIVKFITSGPTL